jgi:hypothetical protein
MGRKPTVNFWWVIIFHNPKTDTRYLTRPRRMSDDQVQQLVRERRGRTDIASEVEPYSFDTKVEADEYHKSIADKYNKLKFTKFIVDDNYIVGTQSSRNNYSESEDGGIGGGRTPLLDIFIASAMPYIPDLDITPAMFTVSVKKQKLIFANYTVKFIRSMLKKVSEQQILYMFDMNSPMDDDHKLVNKEMSKMIKSGSVTDDKTAVVALTSLISLMLDQTPALDSSGISEERRFDIFGSATVSLGYFSKTNREILADTGMYDEGASDERASMLMAASCGACAGMIYHYQSNNKEIVGLIENMASEIKGQSRPRKKS